MSSNMTSSKQVFRLLPIILPLILLFSLTLQRPQNSQYDNGKCMTSGNHITLGQYFKANSPQLDLQNPEDHFFTIGCIAMNCSKEEIQGIKLQLGTEHLDPYEVEFLQDEKDPTVSRYALFWKVHKKYAKQALMEYEAKAEPIKWQIVSPSQMTPEFPAWFPIKALKTMNPEKYNNHEEKSVRIFQVADFDNGVNSKPMMDYIDQVLTKETEKFDFLMHVGDFAYEIYQDRWMKGDLFFNRQKEGMSQIPYIMTGGNHEVYQKGKLINYRFRMPGTGTEYFQDQNYYIYRYKNCLFLSLNFDLILQIDTSRHLQMFHYVKRKLEHYKNDPTIKWRVLISHRPFACSDKFANDCWINHISLKHFQDLLLQHKFDLAIGAHVHFYTRLFPQKDLIHLSNTQGDLTGYLTQIISGHAGCDHFFPHDVNPTHTLPWDAAAVGGGPTYLDLVFGEEELVAKLIDVNSKKVVDRWTQKSNMFYQNKKKWGMLGTLGLAGLIIGILLMIVISVHVIWQYCCCKNRGSQTQGAGVGGYQKAEDAGQIGEDSAIQKGIGRQEKELDDRSSEQATFSNGGGVLTLVGGDEGKEVEERQQRIEEMEKEENNEN